ncbi:hypothetical protein [Streptomyces alanosinicus]|uniref:Uncharacterized protein n=1 Tax=Streptomyces alanosinicus TaxID=68171 RepID=A0A919D6Z2_9ACTN|nr:hypothetical protein [Streptomyces alanosinicus]GHE11866.1 hypothetical protein GCM10010339_73200 [Streptomyces alanosinicus]
MPEETTAPSPAPATAPVGSGAPSGVIGCLGCGGLVLVLIAVFVVQFGWKSWESTHLDRVAPQDMADKAFRYSQEAYTTLGFGRPVPPGGGGQGDGTGNGFSADYCYDGGLLGMEDKTVDGAYRLNHSWALDRVPAARAAAGLRRLHQRLADEGWDITSYRAAAKGADGTLYAKRDGGDERMSFDWSADRQYFTGGASVPCAYDPGWHKGDTESYSPDSAARSVTAPALAP